MNYRFREKNLSTIEYVLVAKRERLPPPFLPPEAFRNQVLDFIKECPIDLFQLVNAIDYFEDCQRHLWYWGFDFSIFYDDDYEEIKSALENSKQIQLFFIDADIPRHLDIFYDLMGKDKRFRYYYFYHNSENLSLLPYNIINPDDFISLLLQSSEDLISEFGFIGTMNPSISIEYRGFNNYKYFAPTKTNYYLINRIIGNFAGGWSSEQNKQLDETFKEKVKEANLQLHTFNRQNLFLDQIEKVDFFSIVQLEKEVIKPVKSNNPILNPLIIISPFHNPDLKNIYHSLDLAKLLQVEQTENYLNLVETKVVNGLVFGGMELLADRVKFLDDVAFLHSSFTNSPVVRLPIKGRSIYKELSFFRTESFQNISNKKNRKKLKKTIQIFGDLFSTKHASPDLLELIKKRNGQLITISDLPIEWASIDGTPLSFTHDICRLPESSLQGLLSFYMSNKTFEYSIPNNILQKTLVIFGSDEDKFQVWKKETIKLSEKIGFMTRTCLNLETLKKEIEILKPDFLIFDCHGGFNATNNSTYLFIGDEKLDGDYIINNNIFAPIIFLSACGTAPTYGTINTIANAFFHVGALSVTTTYLPISIDFGSILYLRVLNKLDYASQEVMHKNWLEFISHIIRTSTITDAFLAAKNNYPEIDEAELRDAIIFALTDSLIFSKRRELYKNLDNRISKLIHTESTFYSDAIPEYLLYSNLGRGDLILFDTWKEAFLKNNVC